MGKIKRARQKFHHKSPFLLNERPSQEIKDQCEKPDAYNKERIPQMTCSSNIFSNVKITADMLKQQLSFPSVDTASLRNFKSTGPQMTKREKRHMKHNLFLEKIDAIQTSKFVQKEKLKREKTPIVGDLRPLENALPTLELLLKDKYVQKKQKPLKPVPCRSVRVRQKIMMDEIALFHQVVNDDSFRADPFGSIKSHLKDKFQSKITDA